MVKQWHNPKIKQKPYRRYNPSVQNKISTTYRYWFIAVALLCIFVGIAIIGCSAAMKGIDGDLKNELFHVWVGIPLFVLGIIGLIPFVTRKKSMVVLFLVCAVVVMVVCACAAIIAGLRYWMDNWQQAKIALDADNKCTDENDKCVCNNVPNMPADADCDDTKLMVKLLISLIGLSAGGFIVTMWGIYLSFMSICCGPWMYTEWYDEQHDPDFHYGEKENVRTIGHKQRNAAYGEY